MQNNSKIFAIIPAYNEAPRIGAVLENLKQHVDEIIVVDDGSKDNTKSVAENYGCVVISHEINKGMGAAVKTGYKKFLETNGDIAIVVHADGQMNPVEIQKLVEPIVNGGADYVLGSRFKSNTPNFSLTRKVGNRIISLLWKIATGYNLSDFINGYHAVGKKALEKLNFEKWSNDFMIETDAISEMCLKKMKIVEVPTTLLFVRRVSYVTFKDAAKYCLNAFKHLVIRFM